MLSNTLIFISTVVVTFISDIFVVAVVQLVAPGEPVVATLIQPTNQYTNFLQ